MFEFATTKEQKDLIIDKFLEDKEIKCDEGEQGYNHKLTKSQRWAIIRHVFRKTDIENSEKE